MRHIRLTQQDGFGKSKKVLINLDLIVAIEDDEASGGSILHEPGENAGYWIVKETQEEISRLAHGGIR